MIEFVNGNEAKEYFFSQCEFPYIQQGDFKHELTIKVFPGQTFLVYNYDYQYYLNILAVVDITNITMNKKDGITIHFKDYKTQETFNVSYVPQPLSGYEVFGYVPQRSVIERTLLKNEDGSYYESIAAAMVLLMESKETVSLTQDYAMPLIFARKIGLGDGQLDEFCADKGYSLKRW